jgi:hypothetical protein
MPWPAFRTVKLQVSGSAVVGASGARTRFSMTRSGGRPLTAKVANASSASRVGLVAVTTLVGLFDAAVKLIDATPFGPVRTVCVASGAPVGPRK